MEVRALLFRYVDNYFVVVRVPIRPLVPVHHNVKLGCLLHYDTPASWNFLFGIEDNF